MITQETLEKVKLLADAIKRQQQGKALTKQQVALVDAVNETGQTGRPKEGGLKEPIFGSMKSCSGVTGIPQALLSLAKDKGCPAFKLSRVYLFEFLRWQYSQDGDSKDWDSLYKEYRAKREKQSYDKEGSLLCMRDEAVRQVSGCLSDLQSSLERKFKLELPPDLVGRTAGDISDRLMAAMYEVNRACRDRWNKWADVEESKPTK